MEHLICSHFLDLAALHCLGQSGVCSSASETRNTFPSRQIIQSYVGKWVTPDAVSYFRLEQHPCDVEQYDSNCFNASQNACYVFKHYNFSSSGGLSHFGGGSLLKRGIKRGALQHQTTP